MLRATADDITDAYNNGALTMVIHRAIVWRSTDQLTTLTLVRPIPRSVFGAYCPAVVLF